MEYDATLNLVALFLSGAMAAMLAGVLRWYGSPAEQAHYRIWAAAWGAEAAYYLVGAMAFALGVLRPDATTLRLALSVATQVASTFGALLLVTGTLGFSARRPVELTGMPYIVAGAIVLGIAVPVSTAIGVPALIRPIYRATITGSALLASGVIVWRSRRSRDRSGRFLSLALIGFGVAHLHYLLYWLLTATGRRPSYPLGWFTLLDLLWISAIATTMVALGLADEREAGEAALRRRDREFRQMIEQSSDIITILDPARLLLYGSPSAQRILGWGAEMLGRDILDLLHPEDQHALYDRLHAIGPDASPFTVRVRRRDGNWVRLEAVWTRRVNESGDALVIVNARDITERDRLEATLRESQKLESVGRLAGGMAHDLNNILTVIAANAQMNLSETHGAVREGLVDILEATDRAADLTKQLLSFARRQLVTPQVFPVSVAINRTARMVSRLLPSTIDFRVNTDSDERCVDADPGQIEQVLMNLIINARDAITGSGTIEVSTGEVEAATFPDSGNAATRFVTIVVRDTGVGMSDATRDHIFEPFFTTKVVGEGTGLGLATSYGIVRQAGGFITVESQPGAGSTFTVHLPAVAPVLPVTDTPAPHHFTADGKLVLVVEDDAKVRAVVSAVLRQGGYRVLEASNGAEGLTIANGEERIAALVCDVVMPGFGGVELARRIRERIPELAIILMSGYPGERDFLSSLPPGSQFLQKPLRGHELLERLRQLVQPGPNSVQQSS